MYVHVCMYRSSFFNDRINRERRLCLCVCMYMCVCMYVLCEGRSFSHRLNKARRLYLCVRVCICMYLYACMRVSIGVLVTDYKQGA